MKQIFKSGLAAVLAIAGLASCSSDDNDSNSSGKSSVAPSGIVLLSVPDEVVAGDTATIRFRVNPSTALLTKDNFSLDCYDPNVYEVEISDAESQYLGDTVQAARKRATYVTKSESFSIVELLNDSLDGQALDGQYVLRIAAQSTRNIIDCSLWTLVCTTPDAKGDTANITSELFGIKQIPQPKEGIFAWSPQAVSYWNGKIMAENKVFVIDSTYVNGSKWYLMPRKYVNHTTGGVMEYDYDTYVKDVTPMLLKDTTVLTTKKSEMEWPDMYKTGQDHAFTAVPDSTTEPFASYEADGSKNFETLTNVLAVTDKYGHVSVWTQPLNFVLATIIYVELPVDDPVVAGRYRVDDIQSYTLTNYGIDLSIIERYPVQFFKNKAATVNAELGMTPMPTHINSNYIFDGLTLGSGSNKSVAADLLFRKIYLTNELYGLTDDDAIIKTVQRFKRAAAE